jgi:hypothetical protein
MPYIGRSTDGFGVRNRFLYLASADDTSVSGADANGATLTFTDGAYVDVYLNGVLLKPTTDYNTSTAGTIAGLSALNTNDEVTVIVYDVFTVGDMVSATSGGTFSGKVTMQSDGNTEQLKLVSTDADANEGPLAIFHRNSSSPADGDSLGRIYFSGENDAGEEIQYVRFQSILDDASDGTEDSSFRIQTYVGGAVKSKLFTSSAETVFNDDSADVDFRVEGNGDANALFVEGETDKVGIGNNDPADKLHVYESSGQRVARFEANNSTSAHIAFKASNTSLMPTVGVKDEALYFSIGDAVEKARIDSAGNFIVNSDDSTANVIYDDSSGNAGPILHSDHRVDVTRNSSTIALNNTNGSASTYIDFRRVGSTIGTIGHDGSGTVSYNAFTGCHWGRLSDNSKPTILKGTILETIDEMCDWYEVEFTIPEVKYVDGDSIPKNKKIGDVKTEAKGKNHLISLADVGNKKIGDSFTFTYVDGVEYTGTLKLQDDEKHSKCKVSDTADSKKVYGVFFSWDGEDDGYNDMYVAGLGTYVIRVNKDVTVESGDLITSNGDGTAKKQDDDIIRSKTIAKVLANVKQETYSDGSYTVPCALYCG